MGSTSPVVGLFRAFAKAAEFVDIIQAFDAMCASVVIDRSDPRQVYPKLRECISCNEAQTLWACIDNRAAQKPYNNRQACQGTKVLIIGAGPCGLRMAIEAALLGSHVVVLEMRESIMRHNVLHLWPMVIHDLKAIGAKVFYPKFCSGNREHISIKRLQTVLVKLALLVGVEILVPVTFKGITEPTQGRGWRVRVSPSGHHVENQDFNVIIGADGKRHSLRAFSRKCFRGSLAIGITANFINEQKAHDNAIEEIGGVFRVFKPAFFEKLKSRGDIELENFVYYKNDTHYIVMTAVKSGLLRKGILRSDKPTPEDLLKPENINKAALANYARQAANIATDDGLACRAYAKTRTGEDDVAIFDFTALHKADHSCLAVESHGKKLLMSIIGDSLIEPFWPMGTGVARGFLGVFDTAWMMKQWFSGKMTDLQVLGEREGIYMHLPQIDPQKLNTNLTEHTIDPKTRYGPNVRLTPLEESKVKSLYRTGKLPELAAMDVDKRTSLTVSSRTRSKAQGVSVTKELLKWYQKQLESFEDIVRVTDLSQCWLDGRALCAILSRYRPDLIDARRLDEDDPISNLEKALKLLEEVYGLSPFCSCQDLAENRLPDPLALLTYLTQLKLAITKEQANEKPGLWSKKTKLKRCLSERGMLVMMSRKNRKTAEGVASREKRVVNIVDPSSTLTQCQRKQITKLGIKTFEKAASEEMAQVKGGVRASQQCAICGKRLYIAERQSALGYFFHKHCFNCAICQQPLWISNAVLHQSEDNTVSFACQNHNQRDETDATDTDDGFLRWSPGGEEGAQSRGAIDDLSEWMSSMSVSSKKRPVTAPASLQMDLNLVAVGEEILDSDEEADIPQGGATVVETKSGGATLRRKKTFYSLARSLQLMLGHAIQEELSEAEQMEMDIEEEGKRVEKVINEEGGEDQEKEQLTHEFLDLMKEKQELQRKQYELILKAKLFELQRKQAELTM